MNSLFPILTSQVYALPFFVHSIGIQHKQNYVERKQGHFQFQIAYCLKGIGYIHIDNQRIPLKEGDVFFLQKNTAHAYGPSDEQDAFVIKWLIFDGTFCKMVLDAFSFSPFMLWHLKDMGLIEGYFQTIYHMLRTQEDTSQHRISAQMYGLLLYLKEENERPSIGVNKARSDPMVAFIEQHYHQDISLAMIAETINRSTYHACKIFKRDMQTTMLKYLEDIRMKHAKRLLLEEDYGSIEHIAKEIGYGSSTYFCRVFKKNEGLTPIQFRHRMRGL